MTLEPITPSSVDFLCCRFRNKSVLLVLRPTPNLEDQWILFTRILAAAHILKNFDSNAVLIEGWRILGVAVRGNV